ncbi:MAG: hypothetical protein A2Z11_03690 [Candidatus Woykebacteria bacterium RBG_16_43_9]|uniref:Pilus assembly protein PilO n=1 Tax=Candidatus Woykebacteria bacterium RBG_16_43_9 TaxID=1802596 RepID=A0A1G1WCT0_9BACT|nr:MAG: hypothetical protein A2Z11_03690 [Candidatus Woykebacteria bacterium RBG_16_43_9]
MPSTKQQGGLGDSETTKSYFSILATLILLIVLVLLIYPTIQHITKINKEIADARVVKANLETKIRDLNSAQTNLEAIEDDLPTLDLALPVGSDLTPYLKKIEAFAKKYKLSIEAAQFSDVPLSKPGLEDSLKTKQLSYNLTLKGSFTNFRKFITDLEKFIRTSDVTSLNLNKESNENKTTAILQSLNVTTYYIGIDFEPTQSTTTTTNNPSTNGPGGINE